MGTILPGRRSSLDRDPGGLPGPPQGHARRETAARRGRAPTERVRKVWSPDLDISRAWDAGRVAQRPEAEPRRGSATGEGTCVRESHPNRWRRLEGRSRPRSVHARTGRVSRHQLGSGERGPQSSGERHAARRGRARRGTRPRRWPGRSHRPGSLSRSEDRPLQCPARGRGRRPRRARRRPRARDRAEGPDAVPERSLPARRGWHRRHPAARGRPAAPFDVADAGLRASAAGHRRAPPASIPGPCRSRGRDDPARLRRGAKLPSDEASVRSSSMPSTAPAIGSAGAAAAAGATARLHPRPVQQRRRRSAVP